MIKIILNRLDIFDDSLRAIIQWRFDIFVDSLLAIIQWTAKLPLH